MLLLLQHIYEQTSASEDHALALQPQKGADISKEKDHILINELKHCIMQRCGSKNMILRNNQEVSNALMFSKDPATKYREPTYFSS